MERHFIGLICEYDKTHHIYIKRQEGEFVVTIEPEFRHNGTQVLDGRYPRTYGSVRAAKGAVTRMTGERLEWKEIC